MTDGKRRLRWIGAGITAPMTMLISRSSPNKQDRCFSVKFPFLHQDARRIPGMKQPCIAFITDPFGYESTKIGYESTKTKNPAKCWVLMRLRVPPQGLERSTNSQGKSSDSKSVTPSVPPSLSIEGASELLETYASLDESARRDLLNVARAIARGKIER